MRAIRLHPLSSHCWGGGFSCQLLETHLVYQKDRHANRDTGGKAEGGGKEYRLQFPKTHQLRMARIKQFS
jgi:hypothetical protein